jgi:acyl carrier protein
MHASSKTNQPGSPDNAASLLKHFPEEVRAAYARFTATADPLAADVVVLAAVADHMPVAGRELVVGQSDALSLMADLGFDSVAITELVFFLEDLFRVNISNDEIVRVRTIGDLRAFVRQKVSARAGTLPVSPS